MTPHETNHPNLITMQLFDRLCLGLAILLTAFFAFHGHYLAYSNKEAIKALEQDFTQSWHWHSPDGPFHSITNLERNTNNWKHNTP